MSRTFKRYPSVKDYSRYYTPYMKRIANKKVRKDWRVDDGGHFKKMFCSYNIVDYKWVVYNEQELEEVPWCDNYNFESKSKAKKKGKIIDKETIRKVDSDFCY